MIVMMTVASRPHYLVDVMESWCKVRGIENIEFAFSVEPTYPEMKVNLEVLRTFIDRHQLNARIHQNPDIYGVSKNPCTALYREFDNGAEYVIAAEDDLIVSDDILEFHTWASEAYREDKEIAAVCSFTKEPGNVANVVRNEWFSPWVWGTWADRWYGYVGAQWDINCEFYTDGPGHEVGWDWHLVKRILPPLNKKCIFPCASHSNSIGVLGTHSRPEIHFPSDNFSYNYPVQHYSELISHVT